MVKEGREMAERESQSEGKQVKYEQLADLGSGLIIAKVDIMDIREQDINARIMKPEMMKQLTDNIRKRGQLESLPYCALTDKIELISGHHRYRAAKEAGMKEIIIILDISGLNRSQIAAKQLAHNAISGFDDNDTLKEIAKMIQDVDDMMESYIGKDILGEPMAEIDKLLSPTISFDWKNIVFMFLPHQIGDLDKFIKTVESQHPDYIGAAGIDQYKEMMETLSKFQGFSNIKNVGAAIHAMIVNAEQMMDDIGYTADAEWTPLTNIFGGAAIPKESAEVIQEAVKKMMDDGQITSKNKWQFIEYLAADYLAGK